LTINVHANLTALVRGPFERSKSPRQDSARHSRREQRQVRDAVSTAREWRARPARETWAHGGWQLAVTPAHRHERIAAEPDGPGPAYGGLQLAGRQRSTECAERSGL